MSKIQFEVCSRISNINLSKISKFSKTYRISKTFKLQRCQNFQRYQKFQECQKFQIYGNIKMSDTNTLEMSKMRYKCASKMSKSRECQILRNKKCVGNINLSKRKQFQR